MMAQDPVWTVDYSQFSFRMSVSAVLELEGSLLQQGENKVAAFVDGEIRGLGYANLYHDPTDKYLTVFQIGSNLPVGEEVVFQIYSAEQNVVVEARKKINFEADQLLGSIGAPYVISDNRYPYDISVSVTSYEENVEVGQIISAVVVLDEDDDTHFFSLSGFDPVEAATLITIEESNILVAQSPNFEGLNHFTVTLTATDSLGAEVSSQVGFAITDEPEAPTNILLSNIFIQENVETGASVGTLTAVDEDLTDTYDFEILASPDQLDHSYFDVMGHQLVTAKDIDRESQEHYSFDVRVTDSAGHFFEKTVDVFVIDENERPVAHDTLWMIDENLPVGTLVGRVEAFDRDESQTLSYHLHGTTSSMPFLINETSGQVTSSGLIDYESRHDYYLTIRIVDDGLPSLEEVISLHIQLRDVNESPTDVLITNHSLVENRNPGIIVGTFHTIDEDEVDFFNYQVLSVDGVVDATDFLILDNKLLTNKKFNYESQHTYRVEVQSVDKLGLRVVKEIEIDIEDVNEFPFLKDTTFYIPENLANGTVIGSVVGGDEDLDQYLSYNTIGHNDRVFSISATNGEILLDHTDLLNYEQNSLFTLQVVISDDGSPVLTDTAVVYIEVQDVPEKELPIRNYISPNGDGFNDFLTIENVQIYTGYELKIFNGRGSVLYRQGDYDNTWDGYYKGKTLPSGIYYYIFENPESQVRYEGKIYIKVR